MSGQSVLLSGDDRELLELVYNDLCYIKSECTGNPTEHQLRRLSVQLRHLIVDDKLIQCWRLLNLSPKQPTIKAVRLDTESLNNREIALAIGATSNGVNIANVRIGLGSPPTNAAIGKEPTKFDFKLFEYKESCSAFIYGTKVKRRQVISYISNKEGGAHFDRTRNKKDDEIYKFLDKAKIPFVLFGRHKEMKQGPMGPVGKSFIYSELLSIAQDIANSPDIIRFVDCCRLALDIK